LAPYTVAFPKPLVPINGMPILEVVIRQLERAGFRRVTMAVGHLAELLQAYFGDGARWGLEIDYIREDEPLGTVGPLTTIDDLPDEFLVMNGDILTTLSYHDLYASHLASTAELTVACRRMEVNIDLGVLEFDNEYRVVGYQEKPTLAYDASMGVYVFSKSALDLASPGAYMDFPSIVTALVAAEREVKVHLSESRWLDIGRHEDYAQAVEAFEELRHEFLPGAIEEEKP